jgi:Ca2+-transporting ATPase
VSTPSPSSTTPTAAGPEAHATVWHTETADAVTARLEVDPERGLGAAGADERLARFGRNALRESGTRPLWRMFAAQFQDFMIAVLLAAAVVSGFIGEPVDTIAILVIVALNAVIGTVQEYRAERAVAALREMMAPEARVLRDGVVQTVAVDRLVPGDVVILEAGMVVPADLRLLHAHALQLDEAPLTGESLAVDKCTEALAEPGIALGERRNMAFKGTLVTAGRGRGIVIASGMATEIGRIAELLGAQAALRTPLQLRLALFGRRLAVAVLAICAIVFAAGLLRGEPIVLMFLTAVSLAVAAIPEALPAVVTVALAFGARRMSRHRALVRRLPAVETLGSVTCICSDKTGTLTENRMQVDRLYADGGWRPVFDLEERSGEPWDLLGRVMAVSNDAGMDAEDTPAGEPTEVAIFLAAHGAGYVKSELEDELPRVEEIPFDTARKRMTTLHRGADGGVIAFVKGAPEGVLPLCRETLGRDGANPFDHDALLHEAERMAAAGHRVIAFAFRRFDALPDTAAATESELTLLGMAALIDPPRDGAAEAVADCRTAGITPVMITGDHPGTARAIAARIGIAGDDAAVLTGGEMERLSDDAFAQRAAEVRIYARVTPEQKIRIINALQSRGEFVAMTGDGVNDAPALKRADIGVAMGMKGTDVAREAADMVLLDDNFATIVAAVREGRRIFDNIRKFVKYTMTSNSGEIWTLFLAPFLGLPIPLLPIHILWINLVTDGLPGLALAAEREEREIMRRPPRPPRETMFAHGMWQHMIWVGLLIGGLSILSQFIAIETGSMHWQTMVFTVLTLSQLVHVMVIRSERDSLLTIGLASNRPLLAAVAFTVALQLAVIYVPTLNSIFHTAPLSAAELTLCVALSLVVFFAVEAEKFAARRGWIYRR